MQQPDLWMALPFSVSQHLCFPLISTPRIRAQLKPSTAAMSYKNGSGADGWLMYVRDSADIPLLGCSMRIHVPCCFTMEEEKQRPPLPKRAQTLRHVGSAVERLRACLGCGEGVGGWWGGGDGERQHCVGVCMSEIMWACKRKYLARMYIRCLNKENSHAGGDVY